MTSPLPMSDPTDVVGRRIGAYFIDGLIGLLLIPLVLLSFNLHLYDRVDQPSQVAAQDTCERFNRDSTYDPATDTYREPTGPVTYAPDGTDYRSSVCIPWNDSALYVNFEETVSTFFKLYGVIFLLSLINPILLQGLTGATVGKHIVGLRVVREDGRIAGIGWQAIRYLVMTVDGAFSGVVGLILMLTSHGHRRLGDMAASTYVVPKSSVGSPIIVPPKPGTTPMAYPYGPNPPMYPAMYPAGRQPQRPPADPDGPHWDQARGTHIRYDRAAEHWMQWNSGRQEWEPIDQ